MAESQTSLIKINMSELNQNINSFKCEEDVFAACVLVYFYSVEATLDVLENYDSFKFLTYLSKLIF